MSLPNSALSNSTWESEKLFFSGDSYFDDLISHLDRATTSIEIEIYIFNVDTIGILITESLIRAATRKVRVRVIVDGLGSPSWGNTFGSKLTKAGGYYQVYHPLGLRTINNRNHRKLIIIDNSVAFLGSRNFTSEHSEKFSNNTAWRDTSLRVTGKEGILELLAAFESTWKARSPSFSGSLTGLIRVNQSIRHRARNLRDLCNKIIAAKECVLITTPYFIPSRRLILALQSAAKKGVQVQVLVPDKSDVPMVQVVTFSLLGSLLRAGVEVFRYQGAILHAKSLVIDNWAQVGSSNINYRSLLHDLELDCILSKKESIEALKKTFAEDLANSIQVTQKEITNRSFLTQILASFLLLFKRFL